MQEHAKNLEFEQAARVRDQLADLKWKVFGVALEEGLPPAKAQA